MSIMQLFDTGLLLSVNPGVVGWSGMVTCGYWSVWLLVHTAACRWMCTHRCSCTWKCELSDSVWLHVDVYVCSWSLTIPCGQMTVPCAFLTATVSEGDLNPDVDLFVLGPKALVYTFGTCNHPWGICIWLKFSIKYSSPSVVNSIQMRVLETLELLQHFFSLHFTYIHRYAHR